MKNLVDYGRIIVIKYLYKGVVLIMTIRKKILFNQIESFRQDLLGVLEDVTEEMSNIVPEGFNNSIKWNVGHIYLDQYLWIYHKIDDELLLPMNFRELFSYGTNPADWLVEAPTLEELKVLLIEQVAHIKEDFESRLDEELTEPTELEMNTIGEVLPRTLYHEGLHIGAILAFEKSNST